MTSGQQTFGWIGLDAPVEVLAAVGAPVRLDADPSSPSPRASVFAEGGGHPAMRATVDRILAQADTLQRIVIGSTPVTGVWLYNFFTTLERGRGAPALPPLDLVNVSHGDRPSACSLNRRSIARLAAELGAGPDALRTAIRERNAVRALQRRIDALRHGDDASLLGSTARALLDAADTTTAADYLSSTAASIQKARSAGPIGLTPVIYSGPGSPSLELYVALEAQGVTVVGDDADFGSRAIGPDVDETAPPIEGLAARYGGRSPAPAGWSTLRRVEWLCGMAIARKAQAVVFDLPPWSHPPAWDFPAERRALEAIGVASIVLPQSEPAEAAAAVAAVLRSFPTGRRAHV